MELKWEVVESELQALLVEAKLIQNYQPPYNILLKDDKSALYIAITKDDYPKILTLRKPELVRFPQKVFSFGPYQSAYKVRQVLEICRRIFRWCEHPQSGKACFYTHLGLCDGACLGQVLQADYNQKIARLRAFLHGKSHQLIKQIKKELESAVSSQAYEQASILRDQIQAITVVTHKSYRLKPDMTLPVLTNNLEKEALFSLRSILTDYFPLPRTSALERIEGYDISNLGGTNPTASMVVATNGQMDHTCYRYFKIKSLTTPNDYAMLKEALTRRQNHPEWGKPDVILIDGGKGQVKSALSVWKWQGIVVGIAKNPDRLIIPLRLDKKTTYQEIKLTQDLPASRLLQSIRDEAHRFSRKLHHNLRGKNMFGAL